MSTTELIAPQLPAARERGEWDVSRIARGLGGLALASLPGLLTIYLAFNSGGYFAGSQGFVVAILAGTVAIRVACVRHPFAGFSRSLLVAVGGLAAFSLWSLISSRWSHSPARALLDFDLANVYLFGLILFGASARSRRRVRWTMSLTCLSMLAVCIAALATRMRPDLFPIPSSLSPNRLAFPLTYWNALGIFAVTGLILAVHLASSTREARLVRVAATMGIPLFAVTILLTYSRAALVLGALGLVAYFLLARPRGSLGAAVAAAPTAAFAVVHTYQADLISNASVGPAAVAQGRHLATQIIGCCVVAGLLRALLLALDGRLASIPMSGQRQRKARSALAIGCAVAVALGLIGFGGQVLHQWSNFTKADAAGSSDVRGRISSFRIGGRITGWNIALKVFDQHPLDGHGAGTYAIDWEHLRPDSGTALETHSLYLEAMSELGVVGLAAILLALVTMIWGAFARARVASRSRWTAIGVVGVVWALHAGVDWDWEMPAVTLPVVALLACALTRRGSAPQIPARREFVLRVVVGLVALGAAITGARLSISDQHFVTSVGEFNAGNCPAAVADARASVAAVASRPQPYAIVGYCDVIARRPQAAVTAMQTAAAKDPQNWRYLYGVAIASAAAGRDPRPALARAAALDPREQIIQTAQAALSARRRRWHRIAPTLQMPVSTRE